MRYETPELTALTPAIDAIQSFKANPSNEHPAPTSDVGAAYEDWE